MYEGKIVTLEVPIPREPDMEVGDTFYKERVGVDMHEPNGWEYDVWVRTDDGKKFKIPRSKRNHFKVILADSPTS